MALTRWHAGFGSQPSGTGGGSGGSGVSSFDADCLAGDAIGDCVYVTGPKVLGFSQVTKIDPTQTPVQVFVGVVSAKSTATRCTVQRAGEFATPYSVPVAGTLFVGTNSRLTGTAPTPGVGSLVAAQRVGESSGTDEVFISPGGPVHIRRG